MSERTFLDRMMQAGGAPRPVADFHPAPLELADDVFVLDRRLRMPGGAALPARTTILRIADCGLVVISPPPAAAGGLAEIDALGPVAHIVAPNSFHYLYAAEFRERHPHAQLHVAPGLPARVADLPAAARELHEPPAAWQGRIELTVLRASPTVSEVFLFHVASGTLVLTDAAFHLTGFDSVFERVFWRTLGVPKGFGPSRSARWLLLRDRSGVAPALARAAGWPLQRIVVAHGDTVEDEAPARFREAFANHL